MPVRIEKAVELKSGQTVGSGKSLLPKGFPFLVISSTEQIVEPALFFMTEEYLTSYGHFVLNTVIAVAEDLRDWWVYLTEFGLQWDAVTSGDIESYRDAMLITISPSTHEPYKHSTVVRRVGTVISFYRWGHRRGFIAAPVDETITTTVFRSRDTRAMAHLQTSILTTNKSKILPKAPYPLSDTVRPLTPKDVSVLFSSLGPHPSEKIRDGISLTSRGRLLAEVCLNTGVRLFEARAITIYQIQNLVFDEHEPLRSIPLRLTITKGGRPRTVDIPVWLVIELLRYIETERDKAIDAGLSSGLKNHTGLFVNGDGSRGRPGRATSIRSLQEAFANSNMLAGLYVEVEKTCPENGQKRVERLPRFGHHDLRHTYAVWTYYSRRANGDSEPWLYIQSVLGHASVSTTMEIYLRVVREFEAAVSDGVVSAFQRIRDGLYPA